MELSAPLGAPVANVQPHPAALAILDVGAPGEAVENPYDYAIVPFSDVITLVMLIMMTILMMGLIKMMMFMMLLLLLASMVVLEAMIMMMMVDDDGVGDANDGYDHDHEGDDVVSVAVGMMPRMMLTDINDGESYGNDADDDNDDYHGALMKMMIMIMQMFMLR